LTIYLRRAVTTMRPDFFTCPVCGSKMSAGLDSWHRECACSYEASSLQPSIIDGDRSEAIDEALREKALTQLREVNNRTVVSLLESCGLCVGARVLDVGSAHGWFLQALTEHNYKAFGIEPDPAMVSASAERGCHVMNGFFPDGLEANVRYDAITFNDVFEHLPEVSAMMRHCFEAIEPGGLLLINAPNAQGPFYRIAKMVRRGGIKSMWERMWQKDLPSPHLSYFTSSSIVALAERAGFAKLLQQDLPSIEVNGLWQRIRYTRTASLPLSLALWFGIMIAAPLIRMMPSDIVVSIFRKPEVPQTGVPRESAD